jgi:hypothetical protein
MLVQHRGATRLLFIALVTAACDARVTDVGTARPVTVASLVTDPIATDDFNRPDAQPIDGNWVSGPSTFVDLAIVAGGVRGVTFDGMGAASSSATTWPADQWSEARITGLGTSGGAGGVMVRVAQATQSAYAFGVGGGGTWYVIAKFIDGSYIELRRESISVAAGDVLRLEVQADTLRAFRNGALVTSLLDGEISSGNAGLVVYHDDPGLVLDDWRGGATSSEPPPPPPPPPTPPAAPTSLAADPTSSSVIHLAWSDNATNEDGFRIERCTGAGCGTFVEVATVGANATGYNDASLPASTTFAYRVRAFNAGGVSAYTNVATATTSATQSTDVLPDLGMARPGSFSVQSVNGRRLLRYSTTIVNIGAGRFELHGSRGSGDSEMSVVQRIFDNSGGWRDEAPAPTVMVLGGDGHDHWHVRDLQLSELFRLEGGASLARSQKRGFCFWDNVEYRLDLPGAPQSPVYEESGCGDSGSLTTAMGLSIGWGDIYPASLPDQYIEVTGLADGRYRLVVTADAGGWFTETSESNNSTWVDIELYHSGRRVRVLGYGPAAMVASR